MLHIEAFIGEIFVVGINHNLLSQKDVFGPFESFNDRYQLMFSGHISFEPVDVSLSRRQLAFF